MSMSMKQAYLDGSVSPVNLFIMPSLDKFKSKRGINSVDSFLYTAETVNKSPFIRQETYYEESTIRDKSSGSAVELENLNTIEDEEFEIEEITEKGFNYASKTFLETVDTMLMILDDLGNRYNKWKYENNGIYRFYCHKYNLTNIEASRPYYSRILNQLSNIDSISLHLLSTHYKQKSDFAVYSSNDLVDSILCQLDELVSCYCSKKCAFAIHNNLCHVCSDININHTNLKWKYPTTTERFLSLAKSSSTDKLILSEKIKSMERNPSLEWSKPLSRTLSLDQNIFHKTFTGETAQNAETPLEKPKLESTLSKIDLSMNDINANLSESCFIREMGDYSTCVMQYFSERGIMHNFSQPYIKSEETVSIHSFLKAAICSNCGKFCRCRCQRKIFRKYVSAYSLDHSQSSESSESDFLPQSDNHLEVYESRAKEFINNVYRDYGVKSKLKGSFKDFNVNNRMGISENDINSIHSHTLKTGFGNVQFLTNITGNYNLTPRDFERYVLNQINKSNVSINTNIFKGSKIDLSMGSVYYSNLFRGNVSKVTPKEIFEIVNTVPFSCVPVELFNAYKKAEWYEMYTSVWWRLDTRFEDSHLLDEEGNLEPYILNVLESLGYLGNIRYDSSFKVIGVGYYRKKNCYWRYFYVKDIWESFRSSVEYFILISTLPSEVHIDHKLSCFVATKNGIQKKFSFHPSVLNAYTHMVSFVNGNEYKFGRPRSLSMERKNYIKNPCGVDVFDPERVGNQKCTVADVVEVSIKRKLISLSDSSAPRKHYIQKAATATPTIKLKLDPQLIYQGIFVSTPNGSSNKSVLTNGSSCSLGSEGSVNEINNKVNITTNNSYVNSCRAILPNPASPNRRDANCSNYNEYTSTDSNERANTNIINNETYTNGDENNNSASKNGTNGKDGTSVNNLFDLKLNNLNIILSYYPDVCTQYNTIIKQANDLRMQLTLLLSDLKCITFDPVQNGIDLGLNGFNLQNGEASVVKHEPPYSTKISKEEKDDFDVNKRLELSSAKKNSKLPMFDVCYNSITNSWTCFLEVMPCLVCPNECDRNNSCVYYTQGKKLIALICSRMKPSSVYYTFHPHFNPETQQNHHDKKSEVGVVSFSVNQFGHERARLFASQLKTTYKIQALNTMLINIAKDDVNGTADDLKKNSDADVELRKSVEIKLLHNAITTNLTTMLSTHSFIVYDDEEYKSLGSKKVNKLKINKPLSLQLNNNKLITESIKKVITKGCKPKPYDQLNELIKDKVNELNSCTMNETNSLNYSQIINSIQSNVSLDWINNLLNHNDSELNIDKNNNESNLINKNDINGYDEEYNNDNYNVFDSEDFYSSLNQDYQNSTTQDLYRNCVCYYHGNHLRGYHGDLKVSNVVRFNENLHTFSNIFEMSRLVNLNSKKLQYCSRHCCFVTVWKDVMDQTRIMFHHIEKFINLKNFDTYVTKFKNNWPEAVKLHNLLSRSRDSSEGLKMVAKVNEILCECFGNLLNIQKIINESIVASMTIAIRALSDASQEKNLLSRLFLINEHFRASKDAMRNSMVFSNEIVFPFGALHDEATPPISDDDF